MNKRALRIGLLYSIVVIIFKLVILLGGYTLSKFGFYYSNVIGTMAIIPFFFICIMQVRDKEYGGFIGGREAMRLAFTVMAVAILVVSTYNFIEFNWKFKDIAVEYYHSQQYLDILTEQQKQYPDKIKTEDFPKIVEEQVRDLSAFKATTGKLLPMMFFGLGGAFMAAVTLRRKTSKKIEDSVLDN